MVVTIPVWYPPQEIATGVACIEISSETNSGAVEYLMDGSLTPNYPSLLFPKVNTYPCSTFKLIRGYITRDESSMGETTWDLGDQDFETETLRKVKNFLSARAFLSMTELTIFIISPWKEFGICIGWSLRLSNLEFLD